MTPLTEKEIELIRGWWNCHWRSTAARRPIAWYRQRQEINSLMSKSILYSGPGPLPEGGEDKKCWYLTEEGRAIRALLIS